MWTVNGGFLAQKVTGVQRYAIEIVAALDQLAASDPAQGPGPFRVVVPPRAQVPAYTSGTPVETLPGKGPVWTHGLLPFYTRGRLLSLGNIGPLAIEDQILCIHDANIYIAPESYSRGFGLYYRLLLPLLGRRVRHLTSVSHFSAGALAAQGVAPREAFTIIPNGHEHVWRWDATRSRFMREPPARPYIFMLGSRARHKNLAIVDKIARAVDALGYDVLVAGSAGHFLRDEGAGETAANVTLLGHVSDDDLAALYKQAACFVFPSLTEGFGLPALEAMALGCPVIASSTGSLPEVCGEAALYADPRDPKAWLAQIAALTADPALQVRMRDQGPRRAALFSWTASARQYAALLRSP